MSAPKDVGALRLMDQIHAAGGELAPRPDGLWWVTLPEAPARPALETAIAQHFDESRALSVGSRAGCR